MMARTKQFQQIQDQINSYQQQTSYSNPLVTQPLMYARPRPSAQQFQMYIARQMALQQQQFLQQYPSSNMQSSSYDSMNTTPSLTPLSATSTNTSVNTIVTNKMDQQPIYSLNPNMMQQQNPVNQDMMMQVNRPFLQKQQPMMMNMMQRPPSNVMIKANAIVKQLDENTRQTKGRRDLYIKRDVNTLNTYQSELFIH